MAFEQIKVGNTKHGKGGKYLRIYHSSQHYLSRDLVPENAKTINLFLDEKANKLRLEFLNDNSGTHKLSRWKTSSKNFNRGSMITVGSLVAGFGIRSGTYEIKDEQIKKTADKVTVDIENIQFRWKEE